MRKLAYIFSIALFLFGCQNLEHLQKRIQQDPNDALAHIELARHHVRNIKYLEAIASCKEAIRINPEVRSGFVSGHYCLGYSYHMLGRFQESITAYKEALRLNPRLLILLPESRDQEAKIFHTAIASQASQVTPQPPKSKDGGIATAPIKQTPQSGSGSGFFVSKMGHVITNAHVVQNCNKVTIGDNANKQVPAEIINTDRSNDLALLKLSTLEMASAESKSLIQKLGIVVVPLATNGLLRSEDVKLGEKVLVAGYPFGDVFSNTIKVTSGIVSATRGAGDDSGQFQLDAAVQPGNSGGPIYDSGGNIVGVVISQLNKRMMEKAIGSLPENVNFGIKASTVRQFLISSGLPSKKSERTEEKSTEQLAEIAKNQALMVMCLQ